MAFSFLVTLREGIEMALIIAILLGYLRTLGQKDHFRDIWLGVGAAAAVCIAIGAGLEVASQELNKRVLEAFEGIAMIFAVIVLTGMAFWMKRQASGISGELRDQVEKALNRGSISALVLLAATSVGREGLETVLFLFAGTSSGNSGFGFIVGGLLGFGAAVVVGVLIYQGSKAFPLRLFFQVSGVTILVMAAGLLANSVVKFYEAAIITNLGDRPWDTENVISITSNLGKFLNTLVGYDSAPSIMQIGLYWTYLVVVLGAFLFLPSGAKGRVRASRAPVERPPV